MLEHSELLDDIFHFYNFQLTAFVRLNLFLTALMSIDAMQFSMIVGNNSNAMQAINS